MRYLYLTLLLTGCASVAEPIETRLFHTDFSDAIVGEEPEAFFVLDGTFTVEQFEDNHVLKLSGSSVGEFGALFGPRRKEGLKVSMRIRAESRKRSMPAFAIAVNGRTGVRFKVSPAQQQIQLVHNGTLFAYADYKWTSNQSVWLTLSLLKSSDTEWTYTGTISSTPENTDSQSLSYTTKQTPRMGKASLWGFAYSEKPIYFDDVSVFELGR